MKNKYYTPEIEEFQEGLEFESNVYDEDIDIFTNVWEKHIYDYRSGLENELIHTYNDGEIRVKCLDQEDIESLGFKYTGKAIDLWFIAKGEFKIGTWTSYELSMNYGIHDCRCHIKALDRGDDVTLFQGIVKNKSELKKVLKQIGYDQQTEQ